MQRFKGEKGCCNCSIGKEENDKSSLTFEVANFISLIPDYLKESYVLNKPGMIFSLQNCIFSEANPVGRSFLQKSIPCAI